MCPPQAINRKQIFYSLALGLSLVGCAHSGPTTAPVAGPANAPQATDPIDLQLPQNLPVPETEVRAWVHRAAIAITSFYGRYPVNHVMIEVGITGSGAVQGGVENDGNHISIKLGQDTTAPDLTGDWMIAHEMFHLSQPNVIGSYSWMSEGMADYLEPVARVRIGQISVEQFWRDLVEGLPQGQPEKDDRGLDNTPTWGRTYWGGCMFWLLADIQIREQTHNSKSVRDAAKAVLDAGGDGSQEWPLDRLLDTYDRATGTHVFRSLHDQLGPKPVTTDLDGLWKSLGVIYSAKDGSVRFDNTAPLAAVRRGITAKANAER
jgi:hypothetical protein